MPGTQHRSPLFSDKKRLKTCREARGFSQEELIRIVESLPDNHVKSKCKAPFIFRKRDAPNVNRVRHSSCTGIKRPR